jgi:hypothetical protein
MTRMPSAVSSAAELSPTSYPAAANRVVELASPREAITHTVARASLFETRASLTFTLIEVSDVR